MYETHEITRRFGSSVRFLDLVSCIHSLNLIDISSSTIASMRILQFSFWAGALSTLHTVTAQSGRRYSRIETKLTGSLASPGVTKQGRYSIYQCDANTALVQQDLDLLWAALLPVVANTHFGTASPAYQAFFKDSIYDTLVDEIISNVTTGAPLLKKNSPTPQSPLIVCIPGPNILNMTIAGVETDLYDGCKSGASAFYKTQTNWIFLCPFFFKVVQQATTPAAFCPAITNIQFEENGQEGKLVQNQMWILMHEIVHFYLDNSPGPATSSIYEAYDINAAFGLAASDAISNAQSYVWYSACKSLAFPVGMS